MASTTTWGLPLVDDSMPIAPIQGLINPIASALDAALTNLKTAEHVAQAVAAFGSLPTTGNWLGRLVTVTATKTTYVWTGAWEVLAKPSLLADISTFGTGWTAATGTAHKPRVRMEGNQCFLYGAIKAGTGISASDLLTVPTAYRPPTATVRFIGTIVSSAGSVFQLVINNGVVSIPTGYWADSALATGNVLPVVGSWWMD